MPGGNWIELGSVMFALIGLVKLCSFQKPVMVYCRMGKEDPVELDSIVRLCEMT